MKILFVNRYKNWWTGGDYFQMERTADELRKLNCEVDIAESAGGAVEKNLADYDIIHVFNFSMAWARVLLNEKRPGQKFVASMIYHEVDKFITYPTQQQMLDKLDAAIWLVPSERKRVERHLKIPLTLKEAVIPNGIDGFWFDRPLINLTGLWKRPFALTVGRLDEFKGQAEVAHACKNLGINFVAIGGKDRFDNGHVSVYPDMPQAKLRKWYAACAVFVLVSKNELMPLTVMEAGAQGKNIVITNTCEWEVPGAIPAVYGHVNSISAAIEEALKRPRNETLANYLYPMSWKRTAEQIINLYKIL